MAGCSGCRQGAEKFELAMAFQPIVDIETGRPRAYEALVRGANGEGAAEVLARVTEENRYAFDQQCRIVAIEQAVAAGIMDGDAQLSINFLPNAVYSPVACIQLTLKTARVCGLPSDRLIFEFTENEEIIDTGHLAGIVDAYRRMGFTTALDDFGAGHAGLGLLTRFRTDVVKLDMDLIRGIDCNMPQRTIVGGVLQIMRDLGITVFAEGIETDAEFATLRDMGVRYMQGFLFARPELRRLPSFTLAQQRMVA